MAFSAALLLFLGLETTPRAAPPHDAGERSAPEAAPAETERAVAVPVLNQPANGPIVNTVTPLKLVPIESDEAPTGGQQWLEWLAEWQNNRTGMQVRIERRVIIRIPRSTSSRQPLSDIRSGQLDDNWYERKIGKCLAMNSIAGVQIASDDQMLLYLRDRRIIRAQLEKACRARDFYSGFYLEQSDDGRLCVDRDVLQARSGSKCELKRIRQLVPKE